MERAYVRGDDAYDFDVAGYEDIAQEYACNPHVKVDYHKKADVNKGAEYRNCPKIQVRYFFVL